MGKGRIVSNDGSGLYTVEIIFDTARVDAQKIKLASRITELEDQITLKRAEILNKQAELRLDPGNAELKRDYILYKNQLNILLANKINAEKTKIYLESFDFTGVQYSAWCADLSEELSGIIGTVEVPGERGTIQIKPGFTNNATYNLAVDGILQHAIAGTAANVYVNWSIFPGWQKWKPTFRYGQITSKNGDNCNIQLESANSSQQNLNINQTTTLSNVPIKYMDCDGDPFEVGDNVLIKFLSQNWGTPQVVGFKDYPKPCAWTEVETWYFNIQMTDGTVFKLDPYEMKAKVLTQGSAADRPSSILRFYYNQQSISEYVPLISCSHMDMNGRTWLNIPRNTDTHFETETEEYLKTLDPNIPAERDELESVSSMKNMFVINGIHDVLTYIFSPAGDAKAGKVLAFDGISNIVLETWEDRFWVIPQKERSYIYNTYQNNYVFNSEATLSGWSYVTDRRAQLMFFNQGESEPINCKNVAKEVMQRIRTPKIGYIYDRPDIGPAEFPGVFSLSQGKMIDQNYLTFNKITTAPDIRTQGSDNIQSASWNLATGDTYTGYRQVQDLTGASTRTPYFSMHSVIPVFCVEDLQDGFTKSISGTGEVLEYNNTFDLERTYSNGDTYTPIPPYHFSSLNECLTNGLNASGKLYDLSTQANTEWLEYNAYFKVADDTGIVMNEPIKVTTYKETGHQMQWWKENQNNAFHACWSTYIETRNAHNDIRLLFSKNPIGGNYFKLKKHNLAEYDATSDIMNAINSAGATIYTLQDVKYVVTRNRDGTVLTQIQKDFLELINNYRVNEIGADPLVYNYALNLAAKEKCEDPAKIFYQDGEGVWHWDHASADGTNSLDRIIRAGFFDTEDPETEGETGENLGHGVPGTTVQMMFDAWKASPDHNASMIYPIFKEVGFWDAMGVDWDGNPRYFMVTTFGYSNQHGL